MFGAMNQADIGVVVFPGSNSDKDAQYVCEHQLGKKTVLHWYEEKILPGQYKMVILPGGFAYGDYLRTGALARFSPAVESLPAYLNAGGKVLGICNGFQILCEAGLLPGVVTKNKNASFISEQVFVKVEPQSRSFISGIEKPILKMPIAHSEGRYVAEPSVLEALEKNNQVVLRYCSPQGEQSDAFNVNGSTHAIAGITNQEGNVVGLMPHPERKAEKILKNDDGQYFFKAIEKNIF